MADSGVFYCPYIPKMTLVIKEDRYHGAKYYTVYPSFGTWRTFMNWCLETYGPDGDPFTSECCRWYANDGKFWFREKEDLTMFVLRWS